MAREKVKTTGAVLHSWDDVDLALARLAVVKSEKEEQKAKYNAEEQKRREELTLTQQPMETEIVSLELGIQKFCENNRQDFGKAKSRELKHGVVSYRTSTPSVQTKKGFTAASCIELVKVSNYKDLFIRTKLELNKEAILADYSKEEPPKVTDADLSSLGLQVVQEETFGYDCKLAVS